MDLFSVAFFLTNSEWYTLGTITAEIGEASGDSFLMKSTRNVGVVEARRNCSAFSSETGPSSERFGKPPTLTERSNDHFTSLAVTGVAVVEFGALLEPECHRHVADAHVVGELHLELVAVVGRACPSGKRLGLMADEAGP